MPGPTGSVHEDNFRDVCPRCHRPYVDTEDQDIVVDKVVNKAIRVMKLVTERLHAEVVTSPTRAFNDDQAKHAAMLARAMAQIADAKRKLDDRAAEQAKRLTFEERTELFLQWIDDLPIEQQDKLLRATATRLGAAKALPAEVE